MAQISNTLVCTSDPIDLAKGIALFPGYSLDIGHSMGATLWDVNPQILAWRIHSVARLTSNVGVTGPAYGVRTMVSGEVGNGTMHLDLVDDEVQAGIMFGWQLTFNFLTSIQQYCIHWVWDGWHSHFAGEWRNIFSASNSVSLDLLSILVKLVEKLLRAMGAVDEGDKKLFDQMNNRFPSLLRSTYGLVNSRTGFVKHGGSLTATPTLHLDVNLVQFFLEMAEGPAADVKVVQDIARTVSRVAGNFGTGPSLGLSMPTTVSIKSLRADSAGFGGLSFSGSRVTASTGPDKSAGASTVGIEFEHRPGFDITVGWFVRLSVLKIFAWSKHWDIGILAMLGIRPTAGPFDNNVDATIGTQVTAAAPEPELMEVVFNAPGALA